jgi:hypothetical protein
MGSCQHGFSRVRACVRGALQCSTTVASCLTPGPKFRRALRMELSNFTELSAHAAAAARQNRPLTHLDKRVAAGHDETNRYVPADSERMQHTPCRRQQTTCNIHHAADNRQHAADNMQHRTCNIHHAADKIHHAADNMQHRTCNMHQATCTRQQTTYTMLQTTCSRQHAKCTRQHAARSMPCIPRIAPPGLARQDTGRFDGRCRCYSGPYRMSAAEAASSGSSVMCTSQNLWKSCVSN